jgi:hypothetical protein
MSESVKKFVDDLSMGNNAEAGEAFKDALRDKVAAGLDQARVDIAGKIFNGVDAEPISDPKPEYTGPNDKTDAIFDTEGEQIEFTPNTETPTNDESQ